MPGMGADRELLFGLIALQKSLITARQLAEAIERWSTAEDRTLDAVLVEMNAFSDIQQSMLWTLVHEKITECKGNVPLAIEALGNISELPNTVASIIESVTDGTIRCDLDVASNPKLSSLSSVDMQLSAADGTRFKVERFHARGGLGEVYIARDQELNRLVALKEIKVEHAFSDKIRSRFLLEAEITGGLEHPGIVPVYGLGRHADGRPFYAMRFIQGDSYSDKIKAFHAAEMSDSERNLALRALLARFLDVCNAIQYAHDRGVLHRDLKPSNIMLGNYGETLVVDWGLAKPSGSMDPAAAAETDSFVSFHSGSQSAETVAGKAFGTPGYMSPEQERGELEKLGPATDVFALGATLNYVLRGKAKEAKSDATLLVPDATMPAPSPETVSKFAVPRPLAAIVRKATAPEIRDRYPSCQALAKDVQNWLADEPVLALEETTLDRGRRWARKHTARVAGIVASLGVAILALALGSLALGQKNQALTVERDRAELNEQAAIALRDDLKRKEQSLRELVDQLTAAKNHAEQNEKAAIALRDRIREKEKAQRAIVDRWFTAMSQSKQLKETPNTQALRKSLLQNANDFYQQLAKQSAGDEEARYEMANAQFRIGQISAEMSPSPETLVAYQKALSQYEALAKENPSSTSYQHDSAIVHTEIGKYQHTLGSPAKALDSYRKALQIQQTLVDKNPQSTSFAQELARTHLNVGTMNRELGQPNDALSSYQSALGIHENLAKEKPTDIDCIHDLARAYNNIGILFRETGRLQDSLNAYKRAQKNYEELHAKHPKSAMFSEELASSLSNLGLLLRDAGQAKAALPPAKKSQQLFEELARDNPQVVGYRQQLAIANFNLISSLMATGEAKEAASAYERSVSILTALISEYPAVSAYSESLSAAHTAMGMSLAPAGRIKDALTALEKSSTILERLSKDKPREYELADKLAGSYYVRGNVHHSVRQSKEALELFGKASVIFESLVQEKPTSPRYLQELASTYENIGQVHRVNAKPEEALPFYVKAISFFERLVVEHPNLTAYQLDQARVNNNYASLLQELHRGEESLKAYQSALKAYEAIAAKNPNALGLIRAIAAINNNLGNAFRDNNRPAEAKVAYEKAIAVLQPIVQKRPDDFEAAIPLGAGYSNLGFLLANNHDSAGAFANYENAVATLMVCYRKLPANGMVCEQLRNTHWRRAQLFDQLGKPAAADKDWTAASTFVPLADRADFLKVRDESRGKQKQAGSDSRKK